MFKKIEKGKGYSRQQLSRLWGYAGYHALARGVVTPKNSNVIILFVTELKQSSAEPYDDKLVGKQLRWEGPKDHFGEERMLAAGFSGDKIHIFYRRQHHREFLYFGVGSLVEYKKEARKPSKFVFEMG